MTDEKIIALINEARKDLELYSIELEGVNDLKQYGTKRHSGRYPWGSGENPYQHSGDFLSRVEALHDAGLSEKDIAESLGLSTGELRLYKQVAKTERRSLAVATAKSLRDDGLNTSEIARRMGKNESTIRSYFNENSEARMLKAMTTANTLKKIVDEKGAIDVGKGVERELGISRQKLDEALTILEAEGYAVHGIGITQITNTNQQTNVKVLCVPGTTQKQLYQNPGMIKSAKDYISLDDGESFIPNTFKYPSSLSSKRVQIVYAEEGGLEKDGVIELRRGVNDISLGNSSYAQVRILVDGTHYLKGMAMYSDDLPDGVDVRFNTNKTLGTPPESVMKPIKKKDPNDPFGSYISPRGQREYIDENGEKKLSVINKVREEGEWDTWSRTLSSQMLGKQNLQLINRQLNLTYNNKVDEYNDILALTNPTVKRKLLDSFADDCDGAAVHLKAAALPRQRAQVILPINSLKDNEIYAPNFRNGEQVALIRYPHGGTFEIPVLTVNNKHKIAKDTLGHAVDAVGINSKVAERLSGADFDGDTVVVIPTNDKIKIKSTPPLKGLEGFDPKLQYGSDDIRVDSNGNEHYYQNGQEYKIMKNTQTEMGKISNLITDMTIKGAKPEELARAVRHSMVVIDAEKHKLNYKQSYIDNGVAELKKTYQGHINDSGKYSEGASTLLSRASAETQVLKRKGDPNINPVTGEKTYKAVSYVDPKTGKMIFKPSKEVTETYIETYTTKSGEVRTREKVRTQSSTKMRETDDARTLISNYNTVQEQAYAKYANQMKALANQARKELYSTNRLEYKPSAAKEYQAEVASLNEKLKTAQLNAPRERQAQIIANSRVKAIQQGNSDITKDELKKIKQRELTTARVKVGATGKDTRIKITEREWEAIQKGAISDSKLEDILRSTDVDVVRKYATPKKNNELNDAKVLRINSMRNLGYTNAEIADALGISTSTVSKKLKELHGEA